MFRNISAGTLSILILAVLVGLVAAYGVRSVLVSEPPPEQSPLRSYTVPVASANLPQGRRISLGDVSLISMTASELEEREWPITLVMLSPDQVIGRHIREQLTQGEPFYTTNLHLEGWRPDIRSLLKLGYRAVSIQVPRARGGFVSPGAVVDVLFRSDPRAGDEVTAAIPEATIPLVDGAEVLAVDQIQADNGPSGVDLRTINQPNRAPPDTTVVLSVTPTQAQTLEAVRGRGEFTLASRADGEPRRMRSAATPLTLEDVLGIDPPLPEPDLTQQPFVTEIYRGTNKAIQTFGPQVNGSVSAGGRGRPL